MVEWTGRAGDGAFQAYEANHTEKPWADERREQYQEEYNVLRLTKSFLENQLVGVNDRMIELRLLIVDEMVGRATAGNAEAGLKSNGLPKTRVDDPGKLGYGRTETPLDLAKKPKLFERLMGRVSGSIKTR